MFKKFAIPLALLVTLGTSGMLGVSALDDSMPEDFLIRNTATGRYLTIANHITFNGASVVEYDADGIDDWNRWTMETTEDGQTVFNSYLYALTLTVNEEGKLTVAEREDGNAYQQFTVEGDGKEVKLTAGGWMLSPDASDTNGAYIHMSEENERSAWELVPITYNQNHLGDVNRDGTVDVFDLGLSKRFLLDKSKADVEQLALANVDGYNDFGVTDVVLLSKYLLGLDTGFSFQEELAFHFTKNSIHPEVASELPSEPSTEETPTENPTETETAEPTEPSTETPTNPDSTLTFADVPAEYQEALDWIWQNRFVYEGSTTRYNTIFDQIIAGKGTLNFVVRWQSYKTVTYEQRQQFEKLASDCVNAWNDYLRGYDGWEYDHIDVKVVGWAVLDKSCLLDLHDDEIVYDNLIEPYDSQYDTSNGIEVIPDKLPSAPSELSRFDHFTDKSYSYPGGLDKRFDMYLWATQGFPSIGGAGGDWGQRLSDDAYLNMLDGSNLHVLVHEIGHGFGITDFYGENGANDGPPPSGFPDDGTSIMMAGSSMEIKDFDGWMLRCIWSHIKDEEGRF